MLYFSYVKLVFQENSDNAQLIYATLQTLRGFLSWIPIGYVFENNLIDLITVKVIKDSLWMDIINIGVQGGAHMIVGCEVTPKVGPLVGITLQ